MSDTKQAGTSVFNPDEVASINRAYAKALDRLGEEASKDAVRAQLAAAVMLLARDGETDEERLCERAVTRTLGNEPDQGRVYTGL